MLERIAEINHVLAAWSAPVYLVGGAVRDRVLGRPIHDLDYVVGQDAIKLAFWVGNRLGVPAYVLDQERDVGRVMLDAENSLDFARFRHNNTSFGASLEEDLQARDFTMNALAQQVVATGDAPIIDPTGGLADLDAGVVRLAYADALADDPARALRAVRMSLQFGFEIEAETLSAVKANVGELWRISAERVRDEFLKLLMLPEPHRAIQLLQETGLLLDIAPELSEMVGVTQSSPHFEDVFGHTLSVLRMLTHVEAAMKGEAEPMLPHFAHYDALRAYLSRRVDGGFDGWQLLRLAALFHDVGKPRTRTVEESGRIRFLKHDKVGAGMVYERLRQLKFSKEANDGVRAIVKGHMRPLSLANQPPITRRSIFRYFKSTGADGVSIALLSLADNLGKDGGFPAQDSAAWESWQWLCFIVDKLLTEYFGEPEKAVRPPKLVTGQDVMQLLGIGPSKEIGRILSEIIEAQAVGEVSTREEALAMIQAVSHG